eukprot:scaffold18345_cov108-Cylindrotheca_fusiformis.AAC.1
MMKIGGLVQWCKNRHSLGLLPDANEFDRTTMFDMAERLVDSREGEDDGKLNTDAPAIGKFTNDKW